MDKVYVYSELIENHAVDAQSSFQNKHEKK